jgi:hypothetical protein
MKETKLDYFVDQHAGCKGYNREAGTFSMRLLALLFAFPRDRFR